MNTGERKMSRLDVVSFLKKVPLFSQFEENDLELLLERATQSTYMTGEYILRDGDPGDEFFLLLSGQVEIRKGDEALAVFNPGQFFGEMSFLDASERSADVVALDDVRCLVLGSIILRDLILGHPDMALKMMVELSRRLRNTDQESYAALERRVADRTRELTALYEVTAVASEALDLNDTLDALLARSLDAMQTQMGAIQLLNDDSQALELVAHQGIPPNVVEQAENLHMGSGLGHWVMEQREPLLIADITEHPRAAQSPMAIRSFAYLGVPMRAKGKVLGVLSVFREVNHQFNAEDVALLGSIADQVGVVVENAQLRQQAEASAVMQERGRLARDLHDSVTQSIYSVTLFAEAIRRLIKEGELGSMDDYLTELRQTSQQALKELRLLVFELRPSMLKQEGLVGALRQRLSTVEERANIDVSLIHEGDLHLNKPIEVGLYHIAQEALNNALKHASASAVTVRLACNDSCVELEVSDDGRGFEPTSATDKGGLGMVSMRERTEQLGGALSVTSAPGEGTSIRVQVGLS